MENIRVFHINVLPLLEIAKQSCFLTKTKTPQYHESRDIEGFFFLSRFKTTSYFSVL